MDIASATSTPTSSPFVAQRKRADSMPAVVDEITTPTQPPIIRRSQTVYSPLVSSMVQSNTLRDCHQIQSMLMQCQLDSSTFNNTNHHRNGGENSTASEPFVCRTAKKYHAMCLSGERF